MCRCCQEEKKPEHKCSEKKVIKCLPYHISKSGYYCLRKDFNFNDPNKNAITITADNVVLDFKHKKITTEVESLLSLVKVEGAKDVKLSNIHLEAKGLAMDQSVGIELVSTCGVTINSPVLFDLTVAFKTDGDVATTVKNILLKNATPRWKALDLKNSSETIFSGGSIVGGNLEWSGEGINVLVEKLQIDNLNGDGFAGRTIAIFGEYINVRIANNQLIGGLTDDDNVLLLGDGFVIRDVVVEDNIIENTQSAIYAQGVEGYVFRNNYISTSFVENLVAAVVVFGSRNGSIENNTITWNDTTVALTPDAYGIVLGGAGPGSGFECINTVIKENFVTGFYKGYSDNIFGLVADCTVLRNNVATGNVNNATFIGASTVEVDYSIGSVNLSPISVNLDNDPLSTTNGSATIKVTTPSAYGLALGQTITLSDAIDTNGIPESEINASHVISSIVSPTEFEIVVTTLATSTGLGGGNDIFIDYIGSLSTTNGSATIKVTTPLPHGLTFGEKVTLSNAVDTNGIPRSEINTSHVISSIVSPTEFEIVVTTLATSTGLGGGKRVVLSYVKPTNIYACEIPAPVAAALKLPVSTPEALAKFVKRK